MTMAHRGASTFRAISSTFMSGLCAGAVASLPLLAATLEAPDGSRYAMQADAQIVDKTVNYDGLQTLGDRLKLPPAWRYTSRAPETDLVLGAKGTATVVQDELENTYQKLD